MHNSTSNELTRDWIGFKWEREVSKSLKLINANFISNPISSFEVWKKNIQKGCDIRLPFAEVECEFRTKYYDEEEYIKKSHVPRFSCNGKTKIVVTNFKWFFGRKSRKLLHEYHIKLMNLQEFIWYVLSKMKKHTSKGMVNLVSYLLSIVNSLTYNMICYINGKLVTRLEDYFNG